MSILFRRASSQGITSPAQITAYPFTVGCWVNMLSVSAALNTIWSFVDNATDTNIWALYINASEDFQFRTWDGVTLSDATASTGVIVANTWNYVICRGISASNKRISVMLANGSVQHAQSATSVTPAGIDNLSLGITDDLTRSEPSDSMIAEFWYTNSDIQPGGAQLENSLFRQLAFSGPFSVPHILKDLKEYRSFRSDILGTESDEVYYGAGGNIQNWRAIGSPTLGPHPPLLYQGYETQLIYPYSFRPLFELTKTSGGPIDVTQPRAGTSTGKAVVAGRIAVENAHRGISTGVAVDTGREAVQDAKRSTVVGKAVVAGTSTFANATWEKAGTSTGIAVVTARDASQDAKRSTVVGKAVVSGTAAQQTQLSRSGSSTGVAVVTGRDAVQDAKRSTVLGKAVVTGVATAETAGNAQSRAGTSVGLAIVNARTAWMAEIAAQSVGVAIVNGVATFTDDSGGGTGTTRFNPMIASPGMLMNR